MVTNRTTLSEALSGWANEGRNRGLSSSTIRQYETNSRRLLRHFGGQTPMERITADQIAHYLHASGVGRSKLVRASSFALEATLCKSFWEYCTRKEAAHPSVPKEKYLFVGRQPAPQPKLQISGVELNALLDTCSPRDRALIALAFYTVGRADELLTLRIMDVDLSRGQIRMNITKTNQRDDTMPICMELDGELRRWLTHYAESVGSLSPAHRLIPAFRPAIRVAERDARGRILPGGTAEGRTAYNTTGKVNNPANIVRAALERIGYADIPDWDGGMHTLRRSGARAIYDQLVEEGNPDALRIVMSMLHHTSVQTTERYLGITADIRKRNERFSGKYLFRWNDPANRENVVPLRSVEGEGL